MIVRIKLINGLNKTLGLFVKKSDAHLMIATLKLILL